MIKKIGTTIHIFIFTILAITTHSFIDALTHNCVEPTIIFAHGLGGSRHSPKKYQKLELTMASFDFPGSGETDLAQKRDISRLKNAYDIQINKTPDNPFVLFGLSRGASAIINFAGTQPLNLAGIIAESPFDSIENIIKDRVGWFSYVGSLFVKAKFPNYSPKGIHPINSAEKINPRVPVLIICSDTDSVIPVQSSKRLAHKIADSRRAQIGNEEPSNVFLVVFNHADHARIFRQRTQEYCSIVHAFLRHCGLVHNELFADQCTTLITQYML